MKMKWKKNFRFTVICFTLLLLVVSYVSAGWEDMEVLNYYFDIGATPRSEWYPYTEYNPIDNEFMVVWRTSGILRADCDPGDEDRAARGILHRMPPVRDPLHRAALKEQGHHQGVQEGEAPGKARGGGGKRTCILRPAVPSLR